MRDKRTPKDVCGEAKSTLDSLKSVVNAFRRKQSLGAPVVMSDKDTAELYV